MKHKLIFLDIDGVLNSESWYAGFGYQNIPRPPLDPAAVMRLDRIIRETGALLVLSTSWRGDRRIPRWLLEHGCSGAVIGMTPGMWPADRGAEIAAWLNGQARRGVVIERFCILDDGDDMLGLRPWLVRTDWQHGLQDADVERAIQMLETRNE